MHGLFPFSNKFAINYEITVLVPERDPFGDE